jgi:hypothetical protein
VNAKRAVKNESRPCETSQGRAFVDIKKRLSMLETGKNNETFDSSFNRDNGGFEHHAHGL